MHANNVYNFMLKQDIVRYLHHTAGSPVPSTWITAINNGTFTAWPGLTSQLVQKKLPKLKYTEKGQMRQIRKNLWSAKPTPSTPPAPTKPCEMTTESIDSVPQNEVTIKYM